MAVPREKIAEPLRRAALSVLRGISVVRRSQYARGAFALFPVAWKASIKKYLLGMAAGSGRAGRMPASHAVADPVASPSFEPVTGDAGGVGVNLVGFVRGGLGLAENLRSLARSLTAQNFPVRLVDANILDQSRNSDHSADLRLSDRADFPIDVYLVNPDQLPAALEFTREVRRSDVYRIGYWFWELATIPEEWLDSISLVDEIWVASEFVGDAFRAVTNKPVTLVPMVVAPSQTAQNAPSGENGPFTFLFSFDFHSYIARKNPAAVVEAFIRAFPLGHEPARLILKTINGGIFPERLYDLLESCSKDRRIVVNDAYMQRNEMLALMSGMDAYISLHRAEGFGLGLAESMALGKPVIGTGYSGNLQFMNASNSMLVDYVLTKVMPGDYMHGAGQFWAEPDIGHAASLMRSLVADRVGANALGDRAREFMRAHHSPKVSGEAIVQRLRSIYQDRFG